MKTLRNNLNCKKKVLSSIYICNAATVKYARNVVQFSSHYFTQSHTVTDVMFIIYKGNFYDKFKSKAKIVYNAVLTLHFHFK